MRLKACTLLLLSLSIALPLNSMQSWLPSYLKSAISNVSSPIINACSSMSWNGHAQNPHLFYKKWAIVFATGALTYPFCSLIKRYFAYPTHTPTATPPLAIAHIPLAHAWVEKPAIIAGRYANNPDEHHHHIADSLRVFWATKTSHAPYYAHTDELKEWTTQPTIVERSQTPRVTWIGHATFLIQIEGLNIITDPIFYNLSVLYPRNTAPGIAPEQLPHIDIILISHNHYDHTDAASLRFVQRRDNPTCLVPAGNKSLLESFGFNHVIECTWGDACRIETSQTTISFLPAHHWSNRSPFDINKSLWGSWLIRSHTSTIYFAGDSSYGTHFAHIAHHMGPIDIALLPIGPNEPHYALKHEHMNAQEALQAFIDLQANAFIPMHWGTFRLGTDSFIDPINALNACTRQQKSMSAGKIIHILTLGGTLTI